MLQSGPSGVARGPGCRTQVLCDANPARLFVVRCEREVGDDRSVVGRPFSGAFGVVDPGRVEAVGERAVRGDDVESHAEVAYVADAVLPPRESTCVGAPHLYV